MNREDDRRDEARREQGAPDKQRQTNVREQIAAHSRRMHQNARRSDSSGSSIDAEMDRIASQQAPHTKAGRSPNEEAEIRGGMEKHRREMELSAIAGANQRRRDAHMKAADAPTTEGRAKLHKKAEKDFRREPGNTGQRSTVRKPVAVHGERTSRRSIAAAAAQGRPIKTSMNRKERRHQHGRDEEAGTRRPMGGDDRRAGIQLRPANPSRMRSGGNADKVIALRTQRGMSAQEAERARNRVNAARASDSRSL